MPYWNAFVAVLEMHGKGRFFDPRLNDPVQFPVAARNHFGDVEIDPDDDRVTSKLSALQAYQLSIPSPEPPRGSFSPDAAKRGDALFSGKAKCNTCHSEPLWTEPGWNLHTPAESLRGRLPGQSARLITVIAPRRWALSSHIRRAASTTMGGSRRSAPS